MSQPFLQLTKGYARKLSQPSPIEGLSCQRQDRPIQTIPPLSPAGSRQRVPVELRKWFWAIHNFANMVCRCAILRPLDYQFSWENLIPDFIALIVPVCSTGILVVKAITFTINAVHPNYPAFRTACTAASALPDANIAR